MLPEFAVVAIITPAQILSSPEVLASQPVFQRPEVIPQCIAIKSAFTNRLLQELRPR